MSPKTAFRTIALLVLACAIRSNTSAQQPSDARIFVVTHVDVTPNYAADANKILQAFASDSRKDPGIVRFELLQDLGRKNHFTMVEVWSNQQAFDSHLAADHSKRFRDKLQPMLGSPFDERLHTLIQ
jgi:quinol monooxygenase YgiN